MKDMLKPREVRTSGPGSHNSKAAYTEKNLVDAPKVPQLLSQAPPGTFHGPTGTTAYRMPPPWDDYWDPQKRGRG